MIWLNFEFLGKIFEMQCKRKVGSPRLTIIVSTGLLIDIN